MDAVVDTVRSLWIPLQDINMLVPNVAIAEVISYQPFELKETNADWLLGAMQWRGRTLPVISMEAMCGYALPDSAHSSRLAVVNSTISGGCLDFYAIVAADIPRLINADEDALGEALEVNESDAETIACKVQIGSEQAVIPKMDLVQQRIEEVWQQIS